MSRRVRSRRHSGVHGKVNTRVALIGAIALAALGVAAVAFGISQATAEKDTAPEPAPIAATPLSAPASSSVSTDAAETTAAVVASSTVEVPNVVGLGVDEARLVLEAAGFDVTLDDPKDGDAPGTKVIEQSPVAGTLAQRDSEVELTSTPVNEGESTAAVVTSDEPAAAASAGPAESTGWVVAIDPGHQRHSDPKPEPIGPGSTKTKAGVTGGTTGVKTRLPEYEVALQISMNLKERLEKAGVKVVMTRTTNDVRLTNSERAKVANKANADLFVRVHADGSPDSKTSGISTLFPGNNKWTKPLMKESKKAASVVQARVCASTGAVDRGIKARTDLTGFNYSKVPSVLVEAGFMSNPVEDRLLSSPHYQDKLASGMAEGILAYLSESAR